MKLMGSVASEQDQDWRNVCTGHADSCSKKDSGGVASICTLFANRPIVARGVETCFGHTSSNRLWLDLHPFLRPQSTYDIPEKVYDNFSDLIIEDFLADNRKTAVCRVPNLNYTAHDDARGAVNFVQ